jgi:hypothetical protein
MDTVTAFYMAQARHERLLNGLVRKSIGKWNGKDFEAMKGTRAARDSAVAALSSEQKDKHFFGLTEVEVARRKRAREEQSAWASLAVSDKEAA